jgi:hypothetical protein
MAVTSSTINTVPVWQFSGVVTDAQVQTAWAGLVVNGVYVLNRAIYLDETADLTSMTGGFLVDFGTQVSPAILLNTNRDKTKSTFNNFTFLQRTGLSVANRQTFVQTWNGTTRSSASGRDGVSQKGGGVVYGVVGNPGGGDPRFLNEMSFAGLEGVTIYSQEFTEQELQIIIGQTTTLKGLIFEKAYGFPQITTPEANVNVVVYRSTQNTQSTVGGGLIPIRLFPNTNRWAAVCYVDSYVTRNNADILTRLGDFFGSSPTNRAVVMMLNNFTRESFFGASKTNFAPMGNWNAANEIFGGVLKKLRFVDGEGGVVRCYDSRSTTAPQKSRFQESGFVDFLDTDTSPVTDAEGQISLVHIGARATGAATTVVGPAITRFTGQQFTFQKFGFRVIVAPVSMISGDNDLSAFSPIILTEQIGIVRTESEINAATEITTFQDLLEELHVLAIGLSGEQSYNGFSSGNLFTFAAGELITNFATVNVDATATSKISYNASTNTLTIKASIVTGNNDVQFWNNSIGSVNLLNGAEIQGVYKDSSGTSTVLELNPPSDDYSLCIFKADGTTKFFQSGVDAGSYYVFFAPNEAGTYFLAAEKYGQRRTEDTLVLNGGNVWYNITDQEDVGITDDFATASAYTTLSTTSEIYDATAVFRLAETGIKLGQLVARDGLYLDFGNNNVKIQDDATDIVAVAGGVITYKAIVINESLKYNAMKATPPKTITVTDNEIINVLIEDANGDSQLIILGGDNLGYELWKVTTATATDDYETGTLLTTLSTNANPYRFIGVTGFDIVGRDISSGVRRRSSMLKGVYNQAFYVGDQIQLATNAPQLIENNQKLDELILKTDTNLDVKVSTRLAAIDYVAPNNAGIVDANTKLDALENYDDTVLQGKVDDIQTKVDTLENFDDTAVLTAIGTPLQADDYVAPDNAGITSANTKLDAIPTNTLLADDYVAPDNVTIGQIQTKVDTLENYDDTTLQTKVDNIQTSIDNIPATDLTNIETDLEIINKGVQDASLFIPHTTNLN